MNPLVLNPESSAERESIYCRCALEINHHKWIQSERAGRDMGDAAVQQWVAMYWTSFLRERWVEHLQGKQFWVELPRADFGSLHRRFMDRRGLLNEVLGHFKSGRENLDILAWAIDSQTPIDDVAEILVFLDISGDRLRLQFEQGGVGDIARSITDNPRRSRQLTGAVDATRARANYSRILNRQHEPNVPDDLRTQGKILRLLRGLDRLRADEWERLRVSLHHFIYVDACQRVWQSLCRQSVFAHVAPEPTGRWTVRIEPQYDSRGYVEELGWENLTTGPQLELAPSSHWRSKGLASSSPDRDDRSDVPAKVEESALARSQLAFRSELPRLLESHAGEWVAYADGRLVRFGKTQAELYKYCLKELSLPHDRFVIRRILPDAGDEVEYTLR